MGTLNARWLWRTFTAAEWTASNSELLPDEAGRERDTGRVKFGPGAWNSLPYTTFGVDGVTTVEQLAELMGEDPAALREALELGTAALASTSAFDAAGAAAAAQAAAIAASDPSGAADAAEAAAIAASAADATSKANTAETNAKNFAVQRANHTGAQAISTVTNLQSTLDAKADLVGGVIPSAQIPAIAITEYLGSVASQAAMLALVGQKGDWAIRSDLGSVWTITGNDPTQLSDWTAMSYPTSPVQSVNGQTGAVTLAKGDVGLGNVDNTSDAGKPVSTAQQTALDAKEPLLSLAANTFRARSGSGAAANKTITDAGLALLGDSAVPRLGTANTWDLAQTDTAIALPSAPSAGKLTRSVKSIAGRLVPFVTGPSGLARCLEIPEVTGYRQGFQAGPSTAGTYFGVSGTNAGTATYVTPAATSKATLMRRNAFASVITTTNQQVGIRTGGCVYRGNAAGIGGALFVCRFTFESIKSGCRGLVGFGSGALAAALVTGDPSAMANVLGFGFDLADSAWTFMHNDASGTATKEAISGQVAFANNQAFDAYIFFYPNDSVVYFRLDDVLQGTTLIDSSVNTDLPVNTQQLVAACVMSNGTANTTAGDASVGVNGMTIYTER